MLLLVQQAYGIELPIRTLGEYLKRWGVTPQKPITRAYEQRPEAAKAWLAEHKAQIEVFYLPSDSPDLNPDERLNADLKHTLGSRGQTRTKDQLKQAAQAHMDLLVRYPERVRAYFQDLRVKYAD